MVSMKEDPIVNEIRRWRAEYAARFNHDLDAIFQDLKEGERGKDTVRLPAKAAEAAEAAEEEEKAAAEKDAAKRKAATTKKAATAE